ncbi:MAG: peptidylprolyl isomerase [Chitinophagales bacterium]|nr:peptidylprolyl isomerase [Chitinophagales bacterium]
MKNISTLYLLLIAAFYSSAQTQVTFYTTMGDFEVELYDSLTPITSGNMIDLVQAEFYDGIIFHRVIDGFMIQGGDPLGTGYGGPGYTIADEIVESLSNVQMTIAMANAGPNTAGSQFYVNLVNNLFLDGNYTVFGIVISNFSVVQDIGDVPTDASDKPLTDVVMDSIRITFDPTVTIEEPDAPFSNITIYPNPVNTESVVSVHANTTEMATLSVYDAAGALVFIKQLPLAKGENIFPCKEIFIQDLCAGIYSLSIWNGEASQQKKFMITE